MSVLAAHIPINRQRTPCADKNDKLGWKAGFGLSVEGVLFGVRSNSPELLETLKSKFPPHALPHQEREVEVLLSFLQGGATKRAGTKNYHLVYNAWNQAARTLDLDEAMRAFEWNLLSEATGRSMERTYIQAAVVKREEQAVLLVHDRAEASFQDYVEALVAQGARAYGQDYVAINEEAQFEPGWGGVAADPVSPSLVVVVENKPLKRSKMVALSAGVTAMELFRRTPSAHFNPEKALALLSRVAQGTPGFRVRSDSPTDIARLIHKQLSR